MSPVARVAALVLLLAISASGAGPTEPFTVIVPGQGWRIHLEAPPLDRYAGQTKGETFVFQAAGTKGFIVSAYVEVPASTQPGHAACFENYWPKAKRNPLIDQSSVKIDKSARFIRVSYLITPPGEPADKANRHVNYYMAHGGRWIDVHASQSPRREDQDMLFEAFERGLAIEPASPDPAPR